MASAYREGSDSASASRALYHQPPILVFDEATSALDVHAERLAYEALEYIARPHTMITVATA